ncbi:hypothetical protein V1264_016556 [Littorina saxatilis]|uniref:Uncharacterized protein n=1 Tax=Littorina saxatilis TaxID=31220 RepID=A0AAN9BPI9_9CAEN
MLMENKSKPLTPDFENRQYVRSFFSLTTGTGVGVGDVGNRIVYEDYPGGYTLYAFDLSPSMLDGDQIELVRGGGLRMELKFSVALAEPVHVIVYAEMDSLLEIARSRQVITDFAS